MTLLYPSPRFGFNGLEILCLAVALAGIGLLGRRLGWNRRGICLGLILVAPVLVLTVFEATQFMTADELGISAMILNAANRGVSQISQGAFMTGLLLVLPIVRILQGAGVDPTTIRMVLKAVWWLVGNGLVAAIAVTVLHLRSGSSARRDDPILFGGIFAGLALLPTTQLALKTVNYDLFSFAMGTLALLLLLRTSMWANLRATWPILICATLAAQEKLVAGPILVLSVLWIALRGVPETQSLGSRTLGAARSAALALVPSLLITVASLSIVRLLGPESVPPRYWLLAICPISSWAWVPLGLLLPIRIILHWRGWIGLGVIALLIGFAGVVGAAAPALLRFWRGAARPTARAFVWTGASFTAGLFTIGVVGAKFVQGYWAPFAPTPLRKLVVLQKLNGVALHVGATTYPAHVLGLIVYALGVLVIAVPSAVWLAGLVGLLACTFPMVRRDFRRLAVGATLIAVSTLLPIAAAVAGIPFAHRYFNISIALLASGLVSLALAVADWQSQMRPQWTVFAAAALFTALCCCEAFPFRPLFAAFRPFWLNYQDAGRAQPGRLNPSWMGWGEEVVSAGKMLEASCLAHLPEFTGVRCSDVTLYVMQSGAWLPGPSVIHVEDYATLRKPPPTGRNSFYLVNRLYLIQDVYPIPQIAPDFTVSYRGYALAWIFRGDRLAAAGYRFQRPDWTAAERLAPGKPKR